MGEKYQTKAAVQSIGVMGPVVALAVIGLGAAGVDASELPGITENIAYIVDNVVIVSGIVAGIYGRSKASKRITGIIRPKE